MSKVHVVEDKGNGKGNNSYNKKRNNKINPTQTQRKRKVHVGSATSQDISKVSVDH